MSLGNVDKDNSFSNLRVSGVSALTSKVMSDTVVANVVDAATVTTDALVLPTGAANGYVLTSDADGVAAWEAPAAITQLTGAATWGTSVIYSGSSATLTNNGGQVTLNAAASGTFGTAVGTGQVFMTVPLAFRYAGGTDAVVNIVMFSGGSGLDNLGRVIQGRFAGTSGDISAIGSATLAPNNTQTAIISGSWFV